MKISGSIKLHKNLACACFWCACAFFASSQGPAVPAARPAYQSGIASWYGDPFHGRKTASGEIFDKADFTAAHKLLPFGTIVLVRNADNGLEVTVRINDRGPYVGTRIIDLSQAAGVRIGLDKTGTANVQLFIVSESPSVLNPPQKRIQLGSFGVPANAQAMASKARAAGVNVSFETAGTVTRVVVYVSGAELAAAIASLKKAGFTSFQVSDKRP